ncbi:uncharacterized protein [Pseudochaenichthys georgianus]|uniref:uncharacterized protein n=1 Tax=Pseudochaenichthys georgianus TaxID=52239 RepID=UPI0039C2F418
MHEDDRLLCVLCQRSEQTKFTGALSTKEDVTAHQNCLLFSSALFCRNTPQFDDLFGFSVDDVLSEVKRGRQLICNKCKTRGATVGCEVGRCKKSYHYPCAVEERAKIVEDVTKEEYVLYCYKHYPKTQEKNPSENGRLSSSSKSRAYRNPEEAGISKVYCLTCEKSEGNISLESLSYSVVMSYCDKHALGSQEKNASGDSPDQRPTVYSSDSNSSSSRKPSYIKRQLSFRDKQNGTPSKRRSKVSWASLKDDSSNSGDNEPDSITAPLDTDIDDSEHLVREPLTRRLSQRSGCLLSLSHFLPLRLTSPLRRLRCSLPSEVRCKTETQKTADDGERSPSAASSRFWRSCNAAGCTQNIFRGFYKEMSASPTRIQAEQASRRSYKGSKGSFRGSGSDGGSRLSAEER